MSEDVVPFHGEHQAGIATPAQNHLSFAAFDLQGESVNDLRELLQRWSEAATSLTKGRPYLPSVNRGAREPPADTGEAAGLPPTRLTVTIGLGASLFAPSRKLNLTRRKPPQLIDLPPFRGESLEAARSGGDLCVQACANDPQVAFHATHLLGRLAADTAALRWTQLGFGRTSSTSQAQSTPRNLMGFKDGTDNIHTEDAQAMRDFVWVQAGDGPKWMTGGSYLVARRISILFDVWDTTGLAAQERTIGRQKASGAPLGGSREFDTPDLHALGADGELMIPSNAHIRLASPHSNGGQRILRRGYSFSEGVEPGTGELNAGLFFIAFQRDPRHQFVPLQRSLAESDALNRHTLHTSSAVFACPSGCAPGGFVGEDLFV